MKMMIKLKNVTSLIQEKIESLPYIKKFLKEIEDSRRDINEMSNDLDVAYRHIEDLGLVLKNHEAVLLKLTGQHKQDDDEFSITKKNDTTKFDLN